MQTSDDASIADSILAGFASIGWFDWTAIAVILVFLGLGLFRGLAWQASRLVILLAAYVVTLAFGGRLADAVEGWFSGTGDPALHHHVAHSTLFVAVLIGIGVVFWLLQRFSERPDLSLVNRALGAAAGAVSGLLLVLAIVTGLHMFFGEGGIARAAESSTSAVVGRRALELAEDVLPAKLANGARHWREILRDPAVPQPEARDARESEPVEGDFKRLDPVRVQDAPATRER